MANLRDAVISNIVENVKEVLESGEQVNWQDTNGDTALHVAISTGACIEIIRLLVEHDANLELENNLEKCPLDVLRGGSSETLFNLLKIRKLQLYRYKDGQTLLHKTVNRLLDLVYGIHGRGAVEAIDKFWENVAADDDIDLNVLNINAQDDEGETVLHTAANLPLAGRQLRPLLSHFDRIDVYLRDQYGQTFLHAFISRGLSMDHELESILFSGRLRNCNKTVVEQLLRIKNNHGETPLHTYIKETISAKGPKGLDFQRFPFAEAGADLDARDTLGNNAIHYMVECLYPEKTELETDEESSESSDTDHSSDIDDLDSKQTGPAESDVGTSSEKTEDGADLEETSVYSSMECVDDMSDIFESWTENVDYLHRKGANINAVNLYGETPLHLTTFAETINVLHRFGAENSVLNREHQTPLLSYLCRSENSADSIKLFLEKGTDVNHVDTFGNTALHYIAWNGSSTSVAKYLLDHGAKSVCDKQGLLPCQVAEVKMHAHLYDVLCTSKEHKHRAIDKNVIDVKHLDGKLCYVKSQLNSAPLDGSLLNILTLPGLGHVDFIGEANDVRNDVFNFVTGLSKVLSDSNPCLRNTMFQSGSVGEKTKTGMPDEFDFVCLMEEFGDKFYVDEEKSRHDRNYIYLKKRDNAAFDDGSMFVDDDGHMNVFSVREHVAEILWNCFEKQSIFTTSRLKRIHQRNEFVPITPTINFKLRWIGEVYKNLEIDIDFVPACRIKGWWPDGTNLDNLECDAVTAMNEGALLLIQDISILKSEIDCDRKPACRLSALCAEKMHMAALPALPKKAYIACKCICNKSICPSLYTVCTVAVRDIITSYMLKSCMFHVYQSYRDQGNTIQLQPQDEESEERILRQFVIQIFQKFLHFAERKKLESFVLPWQNVFTFTLEQTKAEKKLQKSYRMAFAKIILSILGDYRDLDDVNKKVLFTFSESDEYSDGYTDEEDEDRFYAVKRPKRFQFLRDGY